MPRADRVRGVAIVAFLAMSLSTCAHIENFRADPRNACRGDLVTVRWSARWHPGLEATPEVPGTGAVSGTGERLFKLEETTRFVLTARGLFDEQTAEVDVEVAPPELGFGEKADCSEGAGLRTEFPLHTQLSTAFRVDTVANVLPRAISVTKGQQEVKLKAHGESDALRGQPATGTWILTSPLDPGETCENALRSVRQRLRLRIRLVCGA